MAKQIVGSMSDWSGLLKDLFRQVHDGSMTREMLKAVVNHKVVYPKTIKNEFSDPITDWQNFYKELFGFDLDFSGVNIPEKPREGNWRLLVIADITLETLYAKCKELFSCWRWTGDNLDKIVAYNERDAKSGSYAIWVRDEVEADEKYKNLSANHIKEMGIKTETLAERLIHELKFFKETGKHLDIKNVTLCSGSRYSGGSVPSMGWGDDLLKVLWYFSDYRNDSLRAREAVS